MEAIKNDDVSAMRRIPVNIGRAAQRQLYGFVFDTFAANAVIYDTLALYHATHNNLFATALSGPQFAAHRLAMMKQTGRDTAKRMGIGPSTLLVPMDLEETAADLFRRNAEGLWVLHPSGPGSEVRLESVGLVLTMEAIYEDAVTAAPTAPLAAELPPEPSAPTPQP